MNKSSDKIAKLSEKVSENKNANSGNQNLILEEANTIINKNKFKMESLSTGSKIFLIFLAIKSGDIPAPKSNIFRQNPPSYKSDPITASAYPSSNNTEANKNKANATSNVHFNINITNIVDSNNKIIQALNPLLSSDQYAKVFKITK